MQIPINHAKGQKILSFMRENNRACAQNTTDEPNPDYNGAFKSESDEATGGIYFRPNCIHTENTEGSESCDNSSFLD